MKVYIAGKITGDKNYRAKFEKAAAVLKREGHIVINPAVLPDGLSNADYMRICYAMIDSSECVYFLRDYHESKGALIEFSWAEYTGKKFWFEGSWESE